MPAFGFPADVFLAGAFFPAVELDFGPDAGEANLNSNPAYLISLGVGPLTRPIVRSLISLSASIARCSGDSMPHPAHWARS